MINCCKKREKTKKCKRKDGKIFKLPRKFTKKSCLGKKIKGFSKRSSCAPYKFCQKKGGGLTSLNKNNNMLGNKIKDCSTKPLTGWKRNGKCIKYDSDLGLHTVCAIMDDNFLRYTASKDNDLSAVVKSGQKWCLCEKRWEQAYDNNAAPQVILESTSDKVEPDIQKKIRLFMVKNGGKKKSQFLYHPNNPDKSFDVYINKNPNDTIPIKYTTISDVKDTIKRLEKLYKQNKYPHKRIWQVGMILKVRLEAMKKHKKKLYPNARNVNERFLIANKYFKFLGMRTKASKKDRRKMTFNF